MKGIYYWKTINVHAIRCLGLNKEVYSSPITVFKYNGDRDLQLLTKLNKCFV